jgi:DNA-binding CsgD family transcriptional regulator
MDDWSEAAVWLLLRLEDNPAKRTFEDFLDYVRAHYGLASLSFVNPSLSFCLIKDPCIAMAYSDALIEYSEATDGRPDQESHWTFLSSFETNVRRMLSEPGAGIGCNSLTVPVQRSGGAPGLVILTSDEIPHAWDRRRHDLTINLTRVAYYLNYCVHRLHGNGSASDTKPLNAREMEALTLTSYGKTLSEVAMAMRSSQTIVRALLDSARYKLSALNLRHAVWKAVSTRLID